MTLYLRMALQNLRSNHRFYIPRILTECGLLCCFYIVLTLTMDDRMHALRGGDYLPSFMLIGSLVIALLSVVLMLYANSFLMKQRKRELGLYNVLGMEKKHVVRVLFRESAISSLLGIVSGLVLGMLFYKLCSLLICLLLHTECVLGAYYISPKSLIPSAVLFVLIDLATYLLNCISIARLKPVELLGSSHTGEKEPRVRWLLLIIGLASLGSGYFLAVTTTSPLNAIRFFFIAVLLVMLGTYCLFITGTTFVLKLLKKNERYYYNKKHMTAVSGLLYRMKQNAVGLASICILSTGVLVMISTTVSLYTSMETNLNRTYPDDLYISAAWESSDGSSTAEPTETLRTALQAAADTTGLAMKDTAHQRFLEVVFNLVDGKLSADKSDVSIDGSLSGLTAMTIITEDTWRELGGEPLQLTGNEIALCAISMTDRLPAEQLTMMSSTYSIAQRLTHFPVPSSSGTVVNAYGLVVADEAVLDGIYQEQKAMYGDNASEYVDRLAVRFADRKAILEQGDTFIDTLKQTMQARGSEAAGQDAALLLNYDSIWEARGDLYGMNGAFLFLGILLGLVCLFATVLIIYYKQISEGYEDRSRYQIMEKIGMSQQEVRGTIRSQVLLVFFLPLVTAGVHICFAFPILSRLLKLLLLASTWTFVLCTAISFTLFALVYTAIYIATARTYYKIVH